MFYRLFVIMVVVYFASPIALAAEPEAASKNEAQPEDVQIRKDLAAQLGLTAHEVVFGKPRNFRSESLNSLGLDPISDEAE